MSFDPNIELTYMASHNLTCGNISQNCCKTTECCSVKKTLWLIQVEKCYHLHPSFSELIYLSIQNGNIWGMCFNGPLASYVKLRVAHAPGMPGMFFPASDFKGNQELAIPACITACASRTCCDACQDRLPVVAGKMFPAFPAHVQPAIWRIWQEAHYIICCLWNIKFPNNQKVK